MKELIEFRLNEAAAKYATHEAQQLPGMLDSLEAIKAFKTGAYFGIENSDTISMKRVITLLKHVVSKGMISITDASDREAWESLKQAMEELE